MGAYEYKLYFPIRDMVGSPLHPFYPMPPETRSELSGKNPTFVHMNRESGQKVLSQMRYHPMKNGLCLIATAPLRLHPDHRSEMVSQLLFGECFFVLEQVTDWLHIEMAHDHYRGWVAANQVELVDEATAESLEKAPRRLTAEHLYPITERISGITQLISAGSQLLLHDTDTMKINDKVFHYQGQTIDPAKPVKNGLQKHANLFMHTPYVWGGRSAYGMDCSGYVQTIFRMQGLSMARDAAIQARHGQTIHLLAEARTGDLAFFDNAEEEITHTGLLTGDGHILHAYGAVRKDRIDHHGIFNTTNNSYSHRLRIIKRMTD